MDADTKYILTINGGSSSIKFSLYTHEKNPRRTVSGKLIRIGLERPEITYTEDSAGSEHKETVDASNMHEAVNALITLLDKRKEMKQLAGIGQRVVHGMHFTEPQIATEELLQELDKNIFFDPDHLPGEIELIKTFQKKLPGVQQIVCFDTSFHNTLPEVAKLFPIPRRFNKQGIHKYGFHGLSYSFILEELIRMKEPSAIRGRLIVAHLGNGASMTAIRDGRSVETSMGFTPTGGFMMGTRSGDLDPGLAAVIMKKEAMSASQFNDFVNHDCGLLGVSGTTSDMEDLLNKEGSDHRAAEAIGLFCYDIKKTIGAYTAVLGGLDSFVFTGGIGENAPVIRQRICEGLQYIGIELDPSNNETRTGIISSKNSRVTVYVIPTNEEEMIAKLVYSTLSKN